MMTAIKATEMDDVDHKILNIIQTKFPLVLRPFAHVAKQVGIGEDETIRRISRMLDEGAIRRIRALYDAKSLGYISSLVTCKVEEKHLESVAELCNSFTEISHNYLRDYDYNLWFTIIAKDEQRREMILNKIRSAPGVGDLKLHPAKKIYKLKVDFKMGDKA